MSCPDCFSGAIHEGEPSGITTRLHGLDTYVAEPASGRPARAVVVIIPDAFGWDFPNIRLLADSYAKKRDYRVYAPDFMKGHSAPLSMIDTTKRVFNPAETWGAALAKPYHVARLLWVFVPWFIANWPSRTFPVVRAFMDALRRNEAAHLPVGVAGFCWGGKHAVLLAEGYKADGKPLVDAVFTGHPSFLKLYDEIEKMTVPVSIAVGDLDNQMSPAQAARTREIVEAKPDGRGRGEVRLYPGHGHGFACRCDPKSDDPAAAAEAERQAVAWFEKHFEKVEY
ncbi:dienelactone hydrolase family protein [Xylariaceae sp. FL0804]|nr:dienelactone hydrolase family protein [Xylariaceae sp. FL0804]